MSIPEKDELIINLKVLSKLDKNNKLTTKEKFLNLQSSYILPEAISRWWNGDNRDESLKFLDNLATKSIKFLNENDDLLQNIKESLIGLENLKDTYSKCTQTNARLDVIIEKINKGIKDYENSKKINEDKLSQSVNLKDLNLNDIIEN
tara:strand:+ start:30 stop:473 length:444 start_codon:yes stop_codon:yes gene_type:complete